MVGKRRLSGIGPGEFAALRHMLGLTQAGLAARLDVSEGSVYGWERGAYAISAAAERRMRELVSAQNAQVQAALDDIDAGRAFSFRPGDHWGLGIAARVIAARPTATITRKE